VKYQLSSEIKKRQAKVVYNENSKTIRDRSKARMLTDESLRKKNAHSVKERLIKDTTYQARNREAARSSQLKRQISNRDKIRQSNRVCQESRLRDNGNKKIHRLRLKEAQKKRLLDNDKKTVHRLRLKEAQKKRLLNSDKKTVHRLRMIEAQKKRLLDNDKKTMHRLRMSASQRIRLQDEEKQIQHQLRNSTAQRHRFKCNQIRDRHCEVNRRLQENRRQTDIDYRNKNRVNTLKALKVRMKYYEQNKERARQRQLRISKQASYKLKNRTRMLMIRHDPDSPISQSVHMTHKSKNPAQQKYWISKSKRLSMERQQKKILRMQQRMSDRSSVNMLDVKLIFNKAEYFLRKGQTKVKHLHSKLVDQAKYCMQKIPTDYPPTEKHLNMAFDELRECEFTTLQESHIIGN
jgi:hypothetical protein